MKKLYTVLLALLVSAAALVGLWSLVDVDATESVRENRRLAQKPKFTLSALLDGSYVSELETYYSDTFPGRETLLDANSALNKFYNFSGKEENNMLVIDHTNNMGEGGQAMTPVDPVVPEETQPEETVPEETVPEEPPAEEIPEPNYEDMEITNLGAIVIIGDRAMEIPTATESIIENYAGAVNNIHNALGENARVISLVTPNSGQFYSPKDMHSGSHDQQAMIDLCYSKMDIDVVTVDAYSKLEKHKSEYLYFRTDHHWTQLGAYYAYTAFCDAVGWDAVDLDTFETGSYDRFLGTMYHNTSQYPQSAVLKENPDQLIYYLPKADTTAAFYANADIGSSTNTTYWTYVVNAELPETEYNKYMCFMSGDHPAAMITTDVEGPVALVLKDSYGNAFLPFLTSHYSRIYVIDPREFNQDGKPSLDLAAYVAEREVDDVILVNYAYAINNAKYVKWLNRLVGLAYD
ncbi:MAG: hypothetical protein J6J43_04880 [Oscillospiraceae bacterium]|nr:hypothetical protein [Oscillospiraceae bacterium]